MGNKQFTYASFDTTGDKKDEESYPLVSNLVKGKSLLTEPVEGVATLVDAFR
jgi:hypothetical protein